MNENCKQFYDRSYSDNGLDAQRKYPNEEFCRFMGRNFFQEPVSGRRNINILEVGCGSGANLWLLVKEGFETYGIDLSNESTKLIPQMLNNMLGRGRDYSNVHITCQDMTRTSFESNIFDAVIDVFSSYCLTEELFNTYLDEMGRILKTGGILFSYTPSKKSDAFKNHELSTLLDSSTLNGISRKSSPYCGNEYPFRFMSIDDVSNVLPKHGFKINYLETVSRTYNKGNEYFEFIVYEAIKV